MRKEILAIFRSGILPVLAVLTLFLFWGGPAFAQDTPEPNGRHATPMLGLVADEDATGAVLSLVYGPVYTYRDVVELGVLDIGVAGLEASARDERFTTHAGGGACFFERIACLTYVRDINNKVWRWNFLVDVLALVPAGDP